MKTKDTVEDRIRYCGFRSAFEENIKAGRDNHVAFVMALMETNDSKSLNMDKGLIERFKNLKGSRKL